MSEVNEGVGIILARMETNPEEFFEAHRDNNKWRWIFSENLREVMSEPEKAAIYEGMKRVRRLEITHKAIATIMPDEEEENTIKFRSEGRYSEPKKMVVNAAQAEMIKRMNGPAK
jgi:nucleoside diphosphate kinase